MLELISPQQILFNGEVQFVMLPGSEGDMTVYPGHATLVTLVNPGMIEALDAEGNTMRTFIGRGFAEITDVGVTVLAEAAVMEEELSPEHVEDEIMRLQTEIETAADETVRTTRRSLILRLEQIKITFNR